MLVSSSAQILSGSAGGNPSSNSLVDLCGPRRSVAGWPVPAGSCCGTARTTPGLLSSITLTTALSTECVLCGRWCQPPVVIMAQILHFIHSSAHFSSCLNTQNIRMSSLLPGGMHAAISSDARSHSVLLLLARSLTDGLASK